MTLSTHSPASPSSHTSPDNASLTIARYSKLHAVVFHELSFHTASSTLWQSKFQAFYTLGGMGHTQKYF